MEGFGTFLLYNKLEKIWCNKKYTFRKVQLNATDRREIFYNIMFRKIKQTNKKKKKKNGE